MILSQFEMGHLSRFEVRDNPSFPLKEAMEFNLNNPHFRTALSLVNEDGDVVALFGNNQISNGVVEVWMIPATNLAKHAKSVVWHFKTMTDFLIEKTEIHRVQLAVLENNRKWAETLGFQYEGLVKKYHDGLDHYMYVKVKE